MTTQPDDAAARDYLAYAMIATGGSWARGKDLEEVVARCNRLARADWGKLLDMKGKDVGVLVYDVTGRDRITMDTRGAWDGEEHLEPIEVRKCPDPKVRKK